MVVVVSKLALAQQEADEHWKTIKLIEEHCHYVVREYAGADTTAHQILDIIKDRLTKEDQA